MYVHEMTFLFISIFSSLSTMLIRSTALSMFPSKQLLFDNASMMSKLLSPVMESSVQYAFSVLSIKNRYVTNSN